MGRAHALASREVAREAAQEALSGGSTALGAVLTGFFVAAAEDPGVLFSPVSLLVGGLGSGAFAYDGRHRQPGKDAKRPRGFEAEADVPLPARVAVPGSVQAAALACAFQPGTTILSSVRPGVARAKQLGHKGRAELLELVATKGATALSDSRVKRAFVSQFGLVEEGLVTPGDLVAPEGLQSKAKALQDHYSSPWSDGGGRAPEESAQVVVAGDAQGLFVALGYCEMKDGLSLEPFDVRVPLTAVPVMRGVPRTAPGAPIAYPDRLRILRDATGAVSGAQADAGGRRFCVFRASEGRELAVRTLDV